MPIFFSLAIGPDCSIYNVAVRGSPFLCTTNLLPFQPKHVSIFTYLPVSFMQFCTCCLTGEILPNWPIFSPSLSFLHMAQEEQVRVNYFAQRHNMAAHKFILTHNLGIMNSELYFWAKSSLSLLNIYSLKSVIWKQHYHQFPSTSILMYSMFCFSLDFQGDVQTSVSVLVVLGDRIQKEILLDTQEHWFMSYIGR